MKLLDEVRGPSNCHGQRPKGGSTRQIEEILGCSGPWLLRPWGWGWVSWSRASQTSFAWRSRSLFECTNQRGASEDSLDRTKVWTNLAMYHNQSLTVIDGSSRLNIDRKPSIRVEIFTIFYMKWVSVYRSGILITLRKESEKCNCNIVNAQVSLHMTEASEADVLQQQNFRIFDRWHFELTDC